MKDSNKTFQEDNIALRQYVEELLSTIVEHKPELLEIAHRKGKGQQQWYQFFFILMNYSIFVWCSKVLLLVNNKN